ncbi:MAG: hypothetical protein J5556_00925 [Deltaproteobacteria bacterium]|nr:hypothetical protein [Deltaproteobacteria bacterium]
MADLDFTPRTVSTPPTAAPFPIEAATLALAPVFLRSIERLLILDSAGVARIFERLLYGRFPCFILASLCLSGGGQGVQRLPFLYYPCYSCYFCYILPMPQRL